MDIRVREEDLILVVEDSNDDYEFTKRALRKANVYNPVKRCGDGQEAFDFLHKTGNYADDNSGKPGIILLDLNMPGMDGRMLLKTLKTDSDIKDIPVVILTTSANPADEEGCLKDGADLFLTKPCDLDIFFDMIQNLKESCFEDCLD